MKCCDIKVADLRHRVSLQKPVASPDGAGGEVITWETYASPYAKVTPLTGNERLQADRLENPLRKRILIRYRADLEERHRILFEGRAHNIQYVADVEARKQWLEVGVTQGVAT